MEVGLDDPLDVQAVGFGVGEVLGDVALGVDDDGSAGGGVADQVRRVGQALEVVLPEEHVTIFYPMRSPLRPAPAGPSVAGGLAQPGLGVDGGHAVGRHALGLLEGPDGGLGAPPEVAVGVEAVAELLRAGPGAPAPAARGSRSAVGRSAARPRTGSRRPSGTSSSCRRRRGGDRGRRRGRRHGGRRAMWRGERRRGRGQRDDRWRRCGGGSDRAGRQGGQRGDAAAVARAAAAADHDGGRAGHEQARGVAATASGYEPDRPTAVHLDGAA